ncbi:Cpsf160 [Bugula neritina]|uniref:Cpsf160 n=1 Tax=Bugula neritina TaxID=10212 RepID=A0A7J7KG07_BUGNE|nr:Cpsf160 [Bugula neritina]
MLTVKQLQNIPVDMGSSLSTAIVCDLYLLVVSELGALMLLQLKVTADDLDPRLTVIRQPADLELEAVTACLHKDVSGLFTFPSEVTEETTGSTVSATPLAARRASRHSTSMTEDSHISFTSQEEIDEDELLYGDSEINVTLPDDSNNTAAKDAADMESADLDTAWSTSENTRTTHDPTYWAFITTQDHKLQIYSVPEFTLAYEVKNFNGGHVVLSNSEVEDGGKEPDAKNLPAVKELLITALGPKKHKTYMFARTTAGVLLIYEAFSFKERPTRDRLEMRFSRLQHNVIVRERKRVAKKRNAEGGVDEGKITYSTKLLHSFENIGGYSGVFLTGAYPHWFILSRKGELRCHPMGIDKGIVCMSNFHNINSPRGFLYFNTQWPSRKVPLKTTAHFILYDPESKVYIVVCSKTEVCKKFVRIENDEKQYVEMEKDERFVYPTQENYYIQLLSPINCDFIPGTRINAEEGESITAMEIVSLNTDHQMKTIVSIGTSYCYNEEVTARGKITLYEIIEVVPEPGQPLTKNKLKEIYSKDQKGPVTAVTHVEGMLIAAIGQKIYVFELKDGELCGASFIDTQLYIHQMVSIKNLILIADIQMSVSVLRYQPDHRVLSVVSRDLKPMETYGVEFAVDNTNLGFLATDREQNLSIFLYQPDDIVSSGGTILIKKADINIGTCVNSLCRVRCKLNDPTTIRQFSGIVEKRHVTYYASVDGAVGYLLPLTERVYRRLDMTQKLLYTTIQHTAGLNPMTFRSVKSQNKILQNAQHNLIDGDLGGSSWVSLSLTRRL